MSEILELLDKVNGMSFTEIEIEAEGITLKIKRQAKEAKAVLRNSPNTIEEFGGFSTPKKLRQFRLAVSSGQVKYARDLLQKSFNGDDRESMDFLAHTLEIPLQEIDHPDTWDETMTREMAAIILDPLEKMNGIFKKR